MHILSKDKMQLINLDRVTLMFVDGHEGKILVEFENGDDWQLDGYESRNYAQKALEMLAENIGKKDMFQMPTNEEVRKRFAENVRGFYYTSKRTEKGERKRYGILQKNAKHKTK